MRHPETACTELDADGMILGIKKEMLFEEKQFHLETGDILFLYTDGIIEAQNDNNELFGLTRLCDVLHSCRENSPRSMIDTVLQKVFAYTGKLSMEDDVTMVVMKVM
jgi:sigma-B regulation protein RsbU (phosphoserine phosphatase)